jgi:hypothetical protein
MVMENMLGTFFNNAIAFLQSSATKQGFTLILCVLFLISASGKMSWKPFFVVVLSAGGLFSAAYIGQQIWGS